MGSMTYPDERWNVATLPAFARRNIQFIRGELHESPTHAGPLNDESNPLLDVLVRINELGLVTLSSQPGVPWGQDGAQRAFVEGLCSAAALERLRAGLRGSDMVVVEHGRAGDNWCSICATLEPDGTESLWLGRWEAESQAQIVAYTAGPRLAALFLSARYVQVFDPVWGRQEVLWSSVVNALQQQR